MSDKRIDAIDLIVSVRIDLTIYNGVWGETPSSIIHYSLFIIHSNTDLRGAERLDKSVFVTRSCLRRESVTRDG